jgi:hypothetical protein
MPKTTLSPILVLVFLLPLPSDGFAQEKQSRPNPPELKKLQKEIRAAEWFPSDPTNRLQDVSIAITLMVEAQSLDKPDLAYAMAFEAMKLADSADEMTLSHSSAEWIKSKYEMDPKFMLDWYETAVRRAKNISRFVEVVNLFVADVEAGKGDIDPDEWIDIQKQLEKKVRTSRSDFTTAWCKPKLFGSGAHLELLVAKESDLVSGLKLILIAGEVEDGIKALANCKSKTIAAAAEPFADSDKRFADYAAVMRALMADKKNKNARRAAAAIFKSRLDRLSMREIEEGQRICFVVPPKLVPENFSLPISDGLVKGNLKAVKSDLTNAKYSRADKSWTIVKDFNIHFPPQPLMYYVHEMEIEFDRMDDWFTVTYGEAEASILRFKKEDSKKPGFTHRHIRWTQGVNYWNGSRTYQVGQKIRFKNYNVAGQQLRFENGEYVSQNYHGMEWPNLKIYSGKGVVAKIKQCSMRPILPGDTTILRSVLNNKHSQAIAASEGHSAKLDQDALSKYLEHSSEISKKPALSTPFLNTNEMVMHPVQAGQFLRKKTEVRITQNFWVSRDEVSQLQWTTLMRSNPSTVQGNPYFPVDNIGYKEATEFCKRLTATEKKAKNLPDGYVYRLPTEAEWEYMARAGGVGDPKTEDYWNQKTSGGNFHQIGTSKPNDFGIIGLHGNVEEWTFDRHVNGDPKLPALDDPVAEPNDTNWISVRGATWCDGPGRGNASMRHERTQDGGPNRGFRVVLARRIK